MRAGSGSKPSARPGIFVDARKAADFGIGRYVTGLLGGLAKLDRFELTALVPPRSVDLLPGPVRPVISRVGHYSIGELASVRLAFTRSGASLLHAPHYVVPFFPPARTVVTIHDLMHLTRPEHASPAKRLYARTMLGRAVGSAARILCVSSAVARELEGAFPASRGKTVVTGNGVDARFLAGVPRDEGESLRARYRLPASWVLFLGNDKPHKNLDGLLHGFALAVARGGAASQTVLVLAGGAEERRGARARAAADAGLAEGSVLDLGVIPDRDVAPLLAGASLLALPSFDEGFGLPVLEAQALGTAVICSNRGGLPEAAGDAALLVDPDPDSLAEGLERLLGDDALRRDLAEKGKLRARERTWAVVAARTAEVYREVLAGSG
jgi:alpha-1,3-rhamnosyl/mannosyltransferase